MALPENVDVDKLAEVVLALLSLTTFTDRGLTRAWKGLDWDVLEVLHERGLIEDPKGKARSVVLTARGSELAESAFRKHFLRKAEGSEVVHGAQTAKFSSQSCAGGIANALRAAHLIPPETLPAHLGLEYIGAAIWLVETPDRGVVVHVELSPIEPGSWLIAVVPALRADLRVRPVVVRRRRGAPESTHPSAALHAYNVACVVHEFLRATCTSVRWAVNAAPDQLAWSLEPVPPASTSV